MPTSLSASQHRERRMSPSLPGWAEEVPQPGASRPQEGGAARHGERGLTGRAHREVGRHCDVGLVVGHSSDFGKPVPNAHRTSAALLRPLPRMARPLAHGIAHTPIRVPPRLHRVQQRVLAAPVRAQAVRCARPLRGRRLSRPDVSGLRLRSCGMNAPKAPLWRTRRSRARHRMSVHHMRRLAPRPV